MKEYRFINLFRALAAFWVLAAHCQIWGGHRWLEIPAPGLAVDLFMLVSGFLMAANSTSRNEPLTMPRNRARFWVRRFFRIAPAYYLALAVVALGSGFLLPGKAALQALTPQQFGGVYDIARIHYTADSLAAHVTFLFGLMPQYAYSTSLPDWSLSLEMQFYLAFPLLFLLRTRTLIVAALAVYLLGRWIDGQIYFPEPSLLAFKLQYFVAGMLLFRALSCGLRECVGLLACAFVLASLEGNAYPPALLLAMYGLGLLELRGQTPKPLADFIGGRVVRYASDVSYSVYLFHGVMFSLFGLLLANNPSLAALPAQWRTLALLAFAGVGAYMLAGVVYRWVELPGIALGRRVLAVKLTGNQPAVA